MAATALAALLWTSWAASGPVPAEPPNGQRQLQALQEAFQKVAATVKPSVVSINTLATETVESHPFEFFFGDPLENLFRNFGEAPAPGAPAPERTPRRFKRRTEGLGSGVITDPRGYILTNEHVVHDADVINVTVKDSEENTYKGRVVGTDVTSDLAVIKIDVPRPLKAATLGDSDRIEVGDWVMAIGSPFGLQQTVTVGIISAVRQSLNVEGRLYTDFIQTDAAINRGNSGGPLVNTKGEIIGVNTAIFAPTGVFAGIGFSIPANQAKEIMRQLIAEGRVVRGWLGVELAPIDDIMARQFRVPEQKGALVNHVLEGSPADKAGLWRSDVIIGINGTRVDSPESLIKSIGNTPPRTLMRLTVIRDAKETEVSLLTGERPAETAESRPESPDAKPGEPQPATWEGAMLHTAGPDINKKLGLPENGRGVVVIGLPPDSSAFDIGLRPGDLIISVNRKETRDLESFLKVSTEINLKEGILLDVNRRGKLIYLSYKKS